MVNTIKKLLNEKYAIAAKSGKTIIYPAKVNYPEDYVEIEKKGDFYSIGQVSRLGCKTILNTNDYNEAIIGACVLAKKSVEPLKRNEKVDIIRELILEGEIDEVIDFIDREFVKDIYEIGKIDDEKLSLLVYEGKTDLLFMGAYLVKDASLLRGFTALFNYCEKMNYIMEWHKEIQDKYNVSLKLCEKLYLLGKL